MLANRNLIGGLTWRRQSPVSILCELGFSLVEFTSWATSPFFWFLLFLSFPVGPQCGLWCHAGETLFIRGSICRYIRLINFLKLQTLN